MTAQSTEKKEVIPAKLNLWIRLLLTIAGCLASYLLIATHFLLSVRTAHLLGDVSYIPPSILRFTGVIFQQGEVEIGAMIVFFIFWLILTIATCIGIFCGAEYLLTMIIKFFTSDESRQQAIWDCVANGFICLVPILALSMLTLLIMPLESMHPAADSASLTQIGELMSFKEFLFMMTQSTFLIFLVCLLVVITCVVAYLLSAILPDDGGFFFFISMFIGVCVGIAVIFALGYYGNIFFDLVKLQTDNAYLTHYLVFGLYALISMMLILPSTLKEKKKTAADLRAKIELKKSGKTKIRRNVGVTAN